MTTLRMTFASPIAVYLDENLDGSVLAPRSSLDGKVVGLLPNWRPAAVNVLKALATLLEQRYRLKGLVLEQQVLDHNVLPAEKLDDLAHRYDAVIAASGD